jgi:CheY-like chemotaxis protein
MCTNETNSMKILIVDDNDDFLNLMEVLLSGHGYTPLLARDGKQAREYLQDCRVDAIISDVFMPGLDGVRFHSYVREFLGYTDVPFIFMSGYDDPYTRDALDDSEVDFFISKMTPVAEIIRTLEKVKVKVHA